MVDLRSMRRVLALDLGLDARAIDRCLASLLPTGAGAADVTAIPLADALRIVTLAEADAAALT